MKYIDAEKLIAEIKRKIESIENCPFQLASFGEEKKSEGELIAYKDALSLITSLQQEKPEVELEKEITPSLVENMLCEFGVQSIEDVDSECLADIARHFYELGLNARKEDYEYEMENR